MADHPENVPKSEHGSHVELLEQFSACLPHVPTSEIVEILAAVSAELEIRGADVRGIIRTIDRLDRPGRRKVDVAAVNTDEAVAAIKCVECGHPIAQHEGNLKLAMAMPKSRRGTRPRGGLIRCPVIVKGKRCKCRF